MEAVVPEEITLELTQILSNLVLGDNEIRSNAEKAVNDRLAQTPELYLLALAQFAIVADTDVMRSFSLVLLRRLLFRPAPTSQPTRPRSALYDHLSAQTITTLERLLLHSLAQEPVPKVRRNAVDTVCDIANQGMSRGRPWHALQSQAFAMAIAQPQQGAETNAVVHALMVLGRTSAYGVFAGAPNLVMDLQPDVVLGVLQRGLEDAGSIEVRTAALRASVAYLESADAQQLARASGLLAPMLSTLASLSSALSLSSSQPKSTPTNYHHLSVFLSILTPLCATHPALFLPHLNGLMHLLSPLILPIVDCGPTPTIRRPFPPRAGSSPFPPTAGTTPTTFTFPPGPAATDIDDTEEHDLRQTLRLSALEFMLTLSEARPGMVRRVQGWVDVVVKACLEGMGELDEDGEGAGWESDDPSSNSSTSETDSPPALYEQSLDRLAIAMGGRAVLPPAFQYIPSMLASYDWRVRHAGLMAIAAIGEGTGKVMLEQLGKVVDLVTPMFGDSHPRVRYAACQCVGQLCTDLEEVIQERYHQQLFSVLIPALEDPEPRVHAHAAAALINFCEGVARDTLVPYLDLIVERLLRLLNPGAGGVAASGTAGMEGTGKTEPKRYVQEQAITTLAMVADASERMFHYASIMPLLLDVLRRADGIEYRKLRVKAMECAGLVAIAVGRDMFRPDAATFVELLIRVQKSPVDPSDTQLGHYLIATWAKVCQAMGPEFEPYLPAVVPSLLQTASAKPDVSVYDDHEAQEKVEEREGWETVVMDGRTLGIRTSAIEEKCQAFETLVIYCSTLGARFAPYVPQTLEVTLPGLSFYYHDGVREACAILVPMLLASGKASNTLTNQMVSATFHQLITAIRTEHDTSFLASLYKCLNDTLRVVGGPDVLPKEFMDGIIEVTKHQLQLIADRRRGRANRAAAGAGAGAGTAIEGLDKEEMALMEEVEDFVLDDMGKMLSVVDPAHPLLVAVGSVKDLGFSSWGSDEEDEE
ncbi:Importin subunit beta-3 [Termitomyces sp. J132]|nr:Importin subunit beta-3 [Termitomyces sp. J132]